MEQAAVMEQVLTGNWSCCNAADYKAGSINAKPGPNWGAPDQQRVRLVVPDNFLDQVGDFTLGDEQRPT